MAYQIRVFPDTDAQARAGAQRWVELAHQAIIERGAFHVALSGGSTPRRLYQHLADPALSGHLDWQRVHMYWGDERSVPLGDPQSNYRLAFESWLAHVPIPGDHIHPLQARPASIDDDANNYGELLRLLLPSPEGTPVLDLVLLGLGGDGHIASLFPGTDILKETHRPVAAVYVDRLHTWRISLTFPVLNAARHVMVVVAGSSKAEIVHRVLTNPEVGPEASSQLPVQGLHPASEVEWYLDAAAARLLPSDLIGGTRS